MPTRGEKVAEFVFTPHLPRVMTQKPSLRRLILMECSHRQGLHVVMDWF